MTENVNVLKNLDAASFNFSTTQPTTSKIPKSQQIKAKKLFKLFIETCIADTDHSTDATLNHATTIMPDGFSKLSIKKLNRCLDTWIKSFYKNFDELNIHRDIFSIIYQDTRQTSQSVMNFSAACVQLCTTQSRKITKNENWNEIVMFGAVLCELALIHHENGSLITRKLNFWINEIVKAALIGNENGLIAFMLILNRLIKNRDVFDQINRGYFKILRTLLEDGDFERYVVF
jgi:hypothetical protein